MQPSQMVHSLSCLGALHLADLLHAACRWRYVFSSTDSCR